MKKTQYKRGLSAFAAMSLSLNLPAALAEDNAEPSSNNTRIETITVIGEKREQSLLNTVSSVSVIAKEALRTMQYQTVSDAVSDIANVVVLAGATPDIRGVTGNGSATGFNSVSGGSRARVSTLIDGVAEPFVADLTGDSGIWDIEQIEVYRGPQSTSNGRNSIGGSIYIKTADPSFDWQGAARVGYRNKDSYVDTSVMLSGPIIDDRLAFRVAAQKLDADTVTDDTEFATNPANYDLNKIDTDRLKAKLLWAVTDDVDLLLTHSSNKEQGDTGRVYYEGDDPWEYKRITFRDITTDSDTTSLKLDAMISDDVSVDVLLAYMDYQWGFDSYEANPAREQQLQFDETNITVDAKINFGLNNNAANGFLGLAYFEREQDILNRGAFAYFGDDESDSVAAYGEFNYVLNDSFNVIVGGRAERESQVRNFTYGRIADKLDKSKTFFLPKLVLQYSISDFSTVALSARQGYNAAGGALDFRAQQYYYFDEETVNSYELSYRGGSVDGDFTLAANLFYNDYDGYQARSSSRVIVNMDKAITYGAELEAVFKPLNDLEIRAGIGLLRTDIKDAGEGYASATGNELNSAPDITANIGLKYWLNDKFSFGVSAKYVDEYYGDIENTDGRVAGGYTVTRLNANYETDNWLVAAFVNNAQDIKEVTTKEPISGRYPEGYAAIVTPRNMGISVTYSF